MMEIMIDDTKYEVTTSITEDYNEIHNNKDEMKTELLNLLIIDLIILLLKETADKKTSNLLFKMFKQIFILIKITIILKYQLLLHLIKDRFFRDLLQKLNNIIAMEI